MRDFYSAHKSEVAGTCLFTYAVLSLMLCCPAYCFNWW